MSFTYVIYAAKTELSIALEEVVFIMVSSITDCFYYERSRNGKLLRKLSWDWGPDELGIWQVVEGEPEDWEEKIVFSKGVSAEQLRRVALELAEGSDEFKLEEARIRELFARRSYEIGGRVPIAEATLGAAVLKELGIERPASKRFEGQRFKLAVPSKPAAVVAQQPVPAWALERFRKLPIGELPAPEDLYDIVEERNNPIGFQESGASDYFAREIGLAPIIECLNGEAQHADHLVALTLSSKSAKSNLERSKLLKAVVPFLACEGTYIFNFPSPAFPGGYRPDIQLKRVAVEQTTLILCRADDRPYLVTLLRATFDPLLTNKMKPGEVLGQYMAIVDRLLMFWERRVIDDDIFADLKSLVMDERLPKSIRSLAYYSLDFTKSKEFAGTDLKRYETERQELLQGYKEALR